MIDRRRWAGVLAAAVLAGVAARAAGQELRRPSLEPRVTGGKCLSDSGTLLARGEPGRGWQPVEKQADVMTRDLLLALPGLRADLEPRPHSVVLSLWGGLPGESGFPVWESEVVLHDSRAFDLDFSLRRGRVVVTNHKTKGPARVWVRLPGEAWQLELPDPGSSVALETYGRWPRGVSFATQHRPGEEPSRVVGLHVLKGQVDLKTDREQYALSAPPGPAYFQWDNVGGSPDGPRKRVSLPDWADPKAAVPAEARAFAAAVRTYEGRLRTTPPALALTRMLAAAGEARDAKQARADRAFAVLGLTALDVLLPVAEALADPHSADVRAAAVLALRHWIGAAPGNDLDLYHLLINRLDYRPAQADTVLQLLHSPFAADQPETYETLIAYLRHKNLAVRELAAWHLYRLAPAGRDIRYDPAGPADARDRGAAEWRKLIPGGSLPPAEKEKK